MAKHSAAFNTIMAALLLDESLQHSKSAKLADEICKTNYRASKRAVPAKRRASVKRSRKH